MCSLALLFASMTIIGLVCMIHESNTIRHEYPKEIKICNKIDNKIFSIVGSIYLFVFLFVESVYIYLHCRAEVDRI